MRKLPVFTMAMAALALIASAVPSLSTSLAYDRALITGGEWWRVLTAYLVHWSPAHLGINLILFMMAGIIGEARSRKGFAVAMTLSALLIGGGFWFLMPKAAGYGGLSGLTFAAAAWIAVTELTKEESRHLLPSIVLAGLIIGGFAEVLAGFSLLAYAPKNQAFEAMPAAHLMGAIAGALVAFKSRPVKKAPPA